MPVLNSKPSIPCVEEPVFRYANADGERYPSSAADDMERRDLFADTLGHDGGARAVGFGQQYSEFLAAQPPHQVLAAEQLLEDTDDLPSRHVTGGMPWLSLMDMKWSMSSIIIHILLGFDAHLLPLERRLGVPRQS